jgi:hypothetical protein
MLEFAELVLSPATALFYSLTWSTPKERPSGISLPKSRPSMPKTVSLLRVEISWVAGLL